MSHARQLTLFDGPPHRDPATARHRNGTRAGSKGSSIASFAGVQRWQLVEAPHPTLLSPPHRIAPASARMAARAASWVDHAPHWLDGEGALFEALLRETCWQAQRRKMYDRWVDVPRLLGELPAGTAAADCVREIGEALSTRYGRALDSVTLAHYRDGSDSVAPHGDKLGSLIPDTVVAIVSLGSRRRLSLRPVRSGGAAPTRRPAIWFELGQGDLFVMGGRCQADWLHAVPKVRHAGPRISLMFRERAPESVR